MSFVVRNAGSSVVVISNLGQRIEASSEFDLAEAYLLGEIWAAGQDTTTVGALGKLLQDGDLVRLETYGGASIPASRALDDAVSDHAAAHESGGEQEISIAGLHGEASDPQPPKAHGASVHVGAIGAHAQLSGINPSDHHSPVNDPTADQKAALDAAPNPLTGANPVADKGYVDARINGMGWLSPVKQRLYAPPGSPIDGDRYLIDGGSASGSWSGHDGEIAEWSSGVWSFTTPVDGSTCTVQDEDQAYTQTASAAPWSWVATGGSTSVHGNEKHSPEMLTVGGDRSDSNLDVLLDGDQDDDVDQFHLHVRRDKSKTYLWEDFVGYRIDKYLWKTSVSGSGSNVSIPSGDYPGGQLRIRSGSRNGRYAELGWSNRRSVKSALGFELECRVKFDDLSDSYTEVGFAHYGGGDDYVSFVRNESDHIEALVQNNGSETRIDTGISASASTWLRLRIEASSSSIKFYIDASLVATITVNIPTDALELAIYHETTGGYSNRVMMVDWIEIIGGREA